MEPKRLGMVYDVYGLGNALVDLQVAVDGAVLAGTGHAAGSMVLIDEEERSTLLARLSQARIMPSAGGSVANSLVGLAGLGGKPCFTGCICDDEHGAAYARSLAAAGVDFRAEYSARPTGTCLVLITPDAQRTMLTTLGCAADITPAGVCEETLRRSRYVYVEGYLWDGPAIDACRHAMEQAHAAGARVAFTASDSSCVKRHHDDYVGILQHHADLFFANADEAAALTGAATAPEAARRMGESCGLAAVTDGASGAYVATATDVIHVPAVPTRPVDTTGAGDAFAAGFLHGVTRGRPLEAAAREGIKLATRVISQYGARPTF